MGNELQSGREMGPMQQGPDHKRMAKTAKRIALAAAAFLILGGFGTTFFFQRAFTPVTPKDEPVTVHIEKGMNSAEIARLLEEKGLIRNALAFRLYLRYHREGSRFQAGEYALKPGMTLEEIVAYLNEGKTVEEPTVRFTIPEGYTLSQIAEQLSKNNLVKKEVFLELAKRPEQFDVKWVKEIPASPDLKHQLEGYLFPETYELKQGSTEKEIIERMLSELDRKLAQLPPGWEKRLQELGITFHQMLTIASLIEREVMVDKERPIVAGIIYNRLDKGMKLQIDATVQYALGTHKERLLYKDLEIQSPFNTYLHEGLPPGPIASPGLKSIEAALYPEKTDYLYYVTKKDGSQEHLFAKTFAEHNRNIETSLKMENQR